MRRHAIFFCSSAECTNAKTQHALSGLYTVALALKDCPTGQNKMVSQDQ